MIKPAGRSNVAKVSESNQKIGKLLITRPKISRAMVRRNYSSATARYSSQGPRVTQMKTNKHQTLKSTSNQSKATKLSSTQKQPDYICSACKLTISDRFLLNDGDKFWHENCLKCDRCQALLAHLGATFYQKSDMNLCRQDYMEMFGQRAICSVCTKSIYASEMVMKARANVYHLECFACQICAQRFCVGDRFYLCENKIVCQYDYEDHILPIERSMSIYEQPFEGIGALEQIQQEQLIEGKSCREVGAEAGDQLESSDQVKEERPKGQENAMNEELENETSGNRLESDELSRATTDGPKVESKSAATADD